MLSILQVWGGQSWVNVYLLVGAEYGSMDQEGRHGLSLSLSIGAAYAAIAEIVFML